MMNWSVVVVLALAVATTQLGCDKGIKGSGSPDIVANPTSIRSRASKGPN